jgi:2-methylisocitrate lyase-like PEP mutase family enzyme
MSPRRASPKLITWQEVLRGTPGPLLLPAAHDALTARLIELAGFTAYQVGGFALVASRAALPDIDLRHLGHQEAAVRDVVAASSLPVLVDVDDGYGDVKNVTYTVQTYVRLGVQAVFMEDQQAPKRCGHLGGNKLLPADVAAKKVEAAVAAARGTDLFVMARTDAAGVEGVGAAIRRAKQYLKYGAHGVYVEGLKSHAELARVGKALKSVPLATSILELGGKTPWTEPAALYDIGFNMILYPTTVLFQAARATEVALQNLLRGQPMAPERGYHLSVFEEIVSLPAWDAVERRFS